MLVESANPAHSLADSSPDARGAGGARPRRRHRRRDDRDGAPAPTTCCRRASPVREVGGDVLQLRVPGQRRSTCGRRCCDPLPGTLPEPEIHARLVEALGRARPTTTWRRCGRPPSRRPAAASPAPSSRRTAPAPTLDALAPVVVLYETLGPDAARRRGRGRRRCGRWPTAAHDDQPRRRAPGRLRGRRPSSARRCSTPSWPAGRGSSSRSTSYEEHLDSGRTRRTAASRWPSPSCSRSWPACGTSARRPDHDEFPFVLVGR